MYMYLPHMICINIPPWHCFKLECSNTKYDYPNSHLFPVMNAKERIKKGELRPSDVPVSSKYLSLFLHEICLVVHFSWFYIFQYPVRATWRRNVVEQRRQCRICSGWYVSSWMAWISACRGMSMYGIWWTSLSLQYSWLMHLFFPIQKRKQQSKNFAAFGPTSFKSRSLQGKQ